LERRGRAAVLRSHKPSAHKAQACGLASFEHDNIVYRILKAQRRLNNEERGGSINASIHCSYFTHSHTLYTSVYIFLLHLRSHVCVLLLGVSTILFAISAPVYLYGLLLAFQLHYQLGVISIHGKLGFERKVGNPLIAVGCINMGSTE
jgi:hypothetical protein